MLKRIVSGVGLVFAALVVTILMGGCSKDKKSTAPQDVPTTPAPKFITNVTVSPRFSIRQGQSFTITASVQNQGADSDSGMICVSFPGLVDSVDAGLIQSRSSGDEPGSITNRPGTVLQDSCGTDSVRSLVSQYVDTRWVAGETNTFTVEVAPRNLGAFTFLVRAALRVPGKSCEYVRAIPTNGLGERVDGQGFPADSFVVTVQPVPAGVDSAQQVLINGGVFAMGSSETEPEHAVNEGPAPHWVLIDHQFYILNHEVSQTEWETVMGWNFSSFPGAWRPVENVTFYDALEYCNRRSVREGLTPVYTLFGARGDSAGHAQQIVKVDSLQYDALANGYRLPTEAEWEYSCRAGTSTAFYTGSITGQFCAPVDPNLDAAGWYCGNSGGQADERSQEIAQKAPNAWGLYDMHGNVEEWCWDCYGPYKDTYSQDSPDTSPTRSYPEPSAAEFRMLRGGSWNSYPGLCRSATRSKSVPGGKSDLVGLRVARNVL